MKSRITIRLTHLLASARPRVFAAYLLLCVSCAWSATQIAITDDIVVSNVSRLGINIGGNNYYDSPSMKVTDTKNFEGISYRQCHEGTLFTNGFGTWRTASNTYINSGWAALMVGGTYRILSGNAAGTTGTIIAVSNIYMMTWNTSQSNVVPFFVLDKPVSLPGGQPQRNAGFMVEKFVLDEGYLNGTYGYWLETNCFLVTGDVSPNSWGVGALNMVGATNRAHFRMATVGQNIAEANGPYRVTFRARKTTAAPVLWVNLDAGIQTNAPVALSTSWTDYSYTMTVTNATGTASPRFTFYVTNGNVLVDDVCVEKLSDPSPVAYTMATVAALTNMRPGILRWLQMGGNTVSNTIFDQLHQYAYLDDPSTVGPNGAAVKEEYGMHEFLELCEEVGAESWYNLPGALDPPEIAQFMEYIAGPSNVGMGKIRAALGHPEPWTKTLRAVHVELGNEIWNSFGYWWCGYKGPDYWSNLFALVKTSPYYTNNIICHSAGQNFSSGMADQVIRDAPTCDRYSIAPYVLSTLNTNDLVLNNTDDKFYRWLFAYPLHSTYINGLPQQYVVMTNRHTEYSVYEFNHHTTSGSAGFNDVNNFVASAGAGVSIVNTMLAMLKQYGMRSQCLFSFTQNSYNAYTLGTPGNVWLWGTVRSTKPGSERYRPTGLGHMIANRVIGGNLTATAHTGDDPSFDGTGYFRGEESSVKTYSFKKLHSYAFREGSRRALIVVNFDVWSNQAVTVKLPQGEAPAGFTVPSWFMAASHVSNNNEFAENVAIVATNYANCTNYFTIAVPPHTIQAFTWQITNVMAVITDVDALDVPENGTNAFRIKLAKQPAAGVTVTVTVSRVTQANANISVQSGSPRYFTSANWSTYQPVTLAAQDDAGYVAGSALFRCAAPGADHAEVTANEVENDANTPPATPGNVSPSDGATGQSVTPTLQSSAFSDSDPGDTHAASQWQVSTDSGFGTLVWDSGADTVHLTSAAPPALGYNTRYYWHVRHRDSGGVWSEYSAATWFETAVDPNAPYAPANQLPVNGAGGVGLTPTLFASAFSDPNGGNTHAASQWQVSAASNFVALVWDSGQDAVHLTNVATPYLPYETRCYWRVRYKDNTGLWGAYSNPTWFDTLTRPHVYVWTNRADGSWTTPGNWMPYGYPNDAADTAVISNQLLGSGTTRSIYVNANVTAGVIRTTGFIASNIYASIKTQNASTLCLKGAAGNALVELAGHCAASWGLEINVPFVLLSDVDVRATSNKILTLSASYIAGTNNLHLDAAAGFLASRIGGSPAFTGKVYTERSVNTVLMQSQSFTYTNATIVVKSGTTLNVGNAARLGQLVLMPGSRLDAYWSSPSSNDNSVTVLGLVTNTAQANSWMNFRGDVRGTGMVLRLNGSGIGTNRFIGSISPGIDGIGRLVLDERLGVTEFGQAGARLRLNIDVSGSGAVPGVDHDQLVLSNQDAALSLQNTDLVLDGALSGTATNWILTVHSNLLNGTAFNSVTNRSGQSAAVVYDYPNNRVGVFSLASTNAIIVSTSSVSVPEGSTAGFSVKLMNPPNGTFTVSVSRVSGDTDISVQSGATLYFTAGDYDTWQPVTLSAAQDDDAADGSATVRCSGAGVGDVNVTATEDDNDTLGITTSTGSVNVPEGSTAGFDAKLTAAPVGTATVTVSRISGDTSISVQSGGTLYFTAGNWSSWQAVTLSAAEDADYTNGIAAIRCAAAGMTSVDVIATEVDNDSELPPGTYVWTNAVGGNWTVAGNWVPNGYPNGPGDTAVFPHENLSGTGSRTIYVDADVTAKAVRITGTIGADLHPTIASSGGKRLHLASNAGNAVIEGAGVNAGSWQADITAPLVLLSDVDLVVPSNKIMAVRSSYFEGTNTMNLRAIAGLIAFRVNGSPDFTGVLCAEQTTASLLFQSQSYMCTNATIVVKGGTTLNLGNAARLGDLVLEPASRLDAYWSSPSSNDNRVTIQGVVTNAAQYSSWMEFRGDVRGEGTLVKINSNPNGTNRFTGSIAPGVDGIGILTLDEQAGVTELGLPGDRLLLNIDVNGSGGVPGVDHDQVIVSNLDVSLTLDTIDLDIDGSLGGTATNWFLTVHSNLVNGTTFNSVTFGGALSAQLVYDYANSRVGVVPGASTNALILSADTVDVPEGSTATFSVKLAYPPSGALTVSTARISGDADLGVSGGAALVFNAGNYSSWQTVTLSADEDGDVDDGSATFRCSAPNTDPDDVTATEQDNDTLVTVSFQQGVSPVGYAGTYDTYLRSGSYSNSNYGTATTLSIRGGYNALVKWDVSAIPTGAIVQSASVQFRVSTAASGAMADIYESKRAWTETGATWVRWNTAIGGTYWQLQGGTGVLDKGSVVFGSFSMASRVTVSNNLGGEGVACVQRWVSNPATNTGFIILRRSGTTSAAVCSRNYSTTSYRPKLTVTYIVGPGGASPQGVPFTGVERTTVAPSSRDSADAQMANAFVADTAVAASNRFVVAGRIDAQTIPDCAPLPVRVTVGGQSESLKAGHWRAVSSGVYVYRLPLGEPGMVRAMRLDYDRGKWLVRGELVRARAAGEPVVVTIGIDGVSVDVQCLPER